MARKDRKPSHQIDEIIETAAQAAEAGNLFPEDGLGAVAPEPTIPTPPTPAVPSAPTAGGPPDSIRARIAGIVAAASAPEAIARGQTLGMGDTVVIARPNPRTGFRTHSSPVWGGAYYLLEDKVKSIHGGKALSRAAYVVSGEVAAHFVGRRDGAIRQRRIALWIDPVGNLGLWCFGLSATGENTWTDSAVRAVALSRKQWVRVTADQTSGKFRTFAYPGLAHEPTWPTWAADPQEVLYRAFGDDGFILDMNHPALEGLDGEEIGGNEGGYGGEL